MMTDHLWLSNRASAPATLPSLPARRAASSRSCTACGSMLPWFAQQMTPTPTWSTTQQTPCSAACGEGLGPNVRRAIFEAATSSSGLSGVLPPHSAALPVSAASPRHFCHCLAAHWSFRMCWLAGHQRGLPSPSRRRQVRAGIGERTIGEASSDSSCVVLVGDPVALPLS